MDTTSILDLKISSSPKIDLPEGDGSYFQLIFGYENDLARFKKNPSYPTDCWEDFELTVKEPAKAITVSHGHQQTVAVILFKKNIRTFALHEAIRKTLKPEESKIKSVIVDVSKVSHEDQSRITLAIGNLLALNSYEPIKFGKKAQKPTKKKSMHLVIAPKSKKLEDEAALGFAQGEAANLVRTLSELPGNELTPEKYVKKIKKETESLAKKHKVTFSFLDQKQLEKRNANAFLAVTRSVPDGKNGIVHLTYKPKKPSGKRVALVGKGLCFDTGGYNIKVGEYMFDMHRDMTGSALTLALFKHLVQTESKFEVHAFMAIAENLISPTAYRPNDVVIASNGVSIEVVDTDAEGRMVLSDTLVLACEQNPDLVIDYATLTGAVVRAIDTRRSGVFSNREDLRELAINCGEACGERVWGFPIGDDYWEGIHSEIADVRQCATTNNSDHIYAATFLSSFVKPEVPWLHVDLASEAHKGGLGLSSKDVTGFGVRFTTTLLERFLSKKIKK